MSYRFGKNGRPKTVLLVTEKPSASREIASHLKINRVTTKIVYYVLDKNSSVATQPVYRATMERPSEDVKPFIVSKFKGFWNNEIVDFKIVATLGHITGYDFTEKKYLRRSSGIHGELFSAAKVYKVFKTDQQRRVAAFLKDEAEGCDDYILWLDCDRAGECICLEILDNIGLEPNDPHVHRARFFGLTQFDIEKALAHLGKVNMAVAMSIDCCLLADLRIGCQFTRFLTNLVETQLGREVEWISFGPCQTPALAFVVEQYKKSKSGNSERDYVLTCHAKVRESSGKIVFKSVNRFNSKENAETAANRLRSVLLGPAPSRQIYVTEENRTEKKPTALTTFELLRMASNDLNMLPHICMKVAERLYTKGKMSYPRTIETKYPETYFKKLEGICYMEMVLNDLGQDKELEPIVRRLMPLIEFYSTDPSMMAVDGSHPPILPLQPIERWEVNDDKEQQQLFDLIFNAFAASLSEDCQYIKKTGRFDIGGIEFTVVENVITEKGFTEFMPKKTITEECIGLKNGQEAIILVPSITPVEEVQSPSLLSVAELITQMEIHRIGTNGSTASHIENLFKRGFVEVIEDQRLKPTDLGIWLIELIGEHAPNLINPDLRRRMEEGMSLVKTEVQFSLILNEWIAKYKEEFDEFMKKVKEDLKENKGVAIFPDIPLPPRKEKFNGKVKI